jgi:Asp-tRNA(Asn)/Glu-tRNA(Gln) amidotransferase A subunit family amidase
MTAFTTAREIRDAIVTGKASAVEFARAALARIDQTNPTLITSSPSARSRGPP